MSMMPELVLKQWLDSRLPADARAWLSETAQKLRNGGDADLYRSISLVTRKIGKADLALTPVELKQAATAREGWNPSDWSLDQAARIYLLLVSGSDGATFLRRLDQLCNTADVGELVAFYRGLPLYPDQPRYVLRAAEGIRTNMKAVFEAVAHRNPYPAEQLSEPASVCQLTWFLLTAIDSSGYALNSPVAAGSGELASASAAALRSGSVPFSRTRPRSRSISPLACGPTQRHSSGLIGRPAAQRSWA